jgi:O-antigen/teichoic acid export membrane protein
MLPVLWLLPCGFLAAGIFQILNYWSVRYKAYAGLAQANVARSATEAVTQIGMGAAAAGPVGLLLGVVGGYVVAACFQLKLTFRRDWGRLRSVNRRGMYLVARRFRSYPTFAAPASFLNNAGLRTPPLILAACYGPIVVGWFALSQRVLGLPMRLVGKSISDVYFGEAAQCIRERPGDLLGMLYRSAGRLTVAAGPLLVFAVVAPTVFDTVFGSEWRAAGEYCRVLVVCYAVGFIVISTTQLTTYGFNHWQLGWDAFRLMATTTPLLLAHHWGCSAYVAIAGYAVGASISYALLFGLNILAIRRLAAGVDLSPAAASIDDGISR